MLVNHDSDTHTVRLSASPAVRDAPCLSLSASRRNPASGQVGGLLLDAVGVQSGQGSGTARRCDPNAEQQMQGLRDVAPPENPHKAPSLALKSKSGMLRVSMSIR